MPGTEDPPQHQLWTTRGTTTVNRKRITAFVAALAAGSSILLAGTATAAPQDPAGRQAGSYISNTKGAVTNWHLGKGQVYGDNLGPGMVDWFTTVYNGSVHEIGLDADLQKQMTYGGGFEVKVMPKAIESIGGSYAARATELSEFTLSAGIWQVTTQARFDRLDSNQAGYVAPTTDTMPQLTVRQPVTDGPEADGGTIMGSAISRAGFTELTGSSVATLVVDGADQTIKVRGFGYNEDRSAFGSAGDGVAAQFTAAARIVVTRIG